jgi:polyhydroxybutyrate depolymerase
MSRASLVVIVALIALVSACDSDSGDGTNAGKGGSSGEAGSAGSKPASPCASRTGEPGQTVIQLSHGDRDRSYVLYVPQGYDASRPLPLVLNFHGYTSSPATQLVFSGLGARADTQGFILALPEGVATSWNSGNCCADAYTNGVDDVGFARAVVADISSKLCVDEERIYATGMSNGGMFAQRLACDAADMFAAIAPVAGVLTLKPEECNPVRPISVMHYHGSADPIVQFTGGGIGTTIPVADSMAFWVAKNGCESKPAESFRQGDAHCDSYPGCRDGVEVTLCTIDGGGHCWPGNLTCPFGTSTENISASDTMWDFMQRYTVP